MENTCNHCGEKISGRIDKKFCSDYCRNAFNNRLNSDANQYVRSINNKLRKNRRILEKLNINTTTRVHRDQLTKEGFDFNFFTNIYQTKKGSTYFFCYDHGYIPLNATLYTIVQKKDYI